MQFSDMQGLFSKLAISWPVIGHNIQQQAISLVEKANLLFPCNGQVKP